MDNLWSMVYSKAGFTFTELYNMPIYLREYFIRKTHEQWKKEDDDINKLKENNNY